MGLGVNNVGQLLTKKVTKSLRGRQMSLSGKVHDSYPLQPLVGKACMVTKGDFLCGRNKDITWIYMYIIYQHVNT